jgi:hypothetical protein
MNIRYLQELLSKTQELVIMGKNAEIEGVICHVVGIVRNSIKTKLLILQYDEVFEHRIEEAEVASMGCNSEIPESNRMVLRGERKIDSTNPFRAVDKVFIGEMEFEVNTSEHRRLNIQDWKHVLLLTECLRHGWYPDGIDIQSIDKLFLTSLELDGDYTAISPFDECTALRFTMRNDSVSYLVEHPITLTVGGQYLDKLLFRDRVSGVTHWVQINKVYLLDMRAEIEKTFTDPKVQEQMTPAQIVQAKSDFEERFQEICPKGMYFPIIEYECEEKISLEFCSRTYLDETPEHRSRAMGFIGCPEESTGILGLKLKMAIIQEAVVANTVSIEAELFQYHYTTTGRDIVFP